MSSCGRLTIVLGNHWTLDYKQGVRVCTNLYLIKIIDPRSSDGPRPTANRKTDQFYIYRFEEDKLYPIK